MVAVTVILAATVGALMFDITDDFGTEAQAGVSIDTDYNATTVTWTSEGNTDEINVNAEILEDSGDYEFEGEGENGATNESLESVGEFTQFHVVNGSGDDEVDVRITAVATADGTETVVKDTTVTVVAGENGS